MGDRMFMILVLAMAETALGLQVAFAEGRFCHETGLTAPTMVLANDDVLARKQSVGKVGCKQICGRG
jgi:hypothetical protein